MKIKRRGFIGALSGAAASLPLAARAQPKSLPVIAFVSTASADGGAARAAAFRKGLTDSGYVEGQNVTIEYHWLEGRTEGLHSLMADVVRRQVAVIATPGSIVAAIAAKSATTTIPIVFGSPEDRVALGLVASLARPGGNATGINSFSQEVIGKRLELLHELLPQASRVAVLINPDNASSTKTTLQGVQVAASSMGLQIKIFNAATIDGIDAVFAALAQDRVDALFVAPDAFFNSRGVQFSALSAHNKIPTSYSALEMVKAGGLMSYGSDLDDMARQVGVYAGKILGGTRPADLPVQQSTKLLFALNVRTARTLGLTISPMLIARADEVIE